MQTLPGTRRVRDPGSAQWPGRWCPIRGRGTDRHCVLAWSRARQADLLAASDSAGGLAQFLELSLFRERLVID
jgi:hypothetical protein